jgi:insecticidal toxin complex protein TccC
VYVSGTLYQMAHAEGRIVPQGADYQYQWSISDHLGNLRVSLVADAAGKAQVVQAQESCATPVRPLGLAVGGLGYVARHA